MKNKTQYFIKQIYKMLHDLFPLKMSQKLSLSAQNPWGFYIDFVKNWVSVALSDIQIHVPGKSKILIYGHKKTDMVYTLAFTNSKKIIFCI